MLHKFNLCKSKLLCYNVDSSALASVCINEQQIQIVDNDVHLASVSLLILAIRSVLNMFVIYMNDVTALLVIVLLVYLIVYIKHTVCICIVVKWRI